MAIDTHTDLCYINLFQSHQNLPRGVNNPSENVMTYLLVGMHTHTEIRVPKNTYKSTQKVTKERGSANMQCKIGNLILTAHVWGENVELGVTLPYTCGGRRSHRQGGTHA